MTNNTSEPSQKRHRRPFYRRTTAVLMGLAVCGAVVYALVGWWVKSSTNQSLSESRSLLADGRPVDARKAISWLLWFEPDHPIAVEIIGRTLQAEGKHAQAAEQFSRIKPSAQNNETAGYLFALATLNSGDFEGAENALKRFLQRYPDSIQASDELKWLMFNQLRRREVEELLEERLARTPNEFSVLSDLLYTEFRRQVPREAVTYLKQANQLKPRQPSILLSLGYCRWRLGDLAEAREILDQALQLRPQHVATRLVAAEFLLEQGQTEAATQLLMPADEDDPVFKSLAADDRWWWLRSRLAQLRGDDSAAVEFVKKAIKLRTFELRYVHGYAAILQSLGRAEAAGELFRQAEKLESCESRLKQITLSGDLEQATPELCREIAVLCAQRGKPREAEGWDQIVEYLRAAASTQNAFGTR